MNKLRGNEHPAQHPAQHVHAEGHPTCSCGQELDICRHAHCPRCGHRLESAQLAYAV